MTIAISSLSTEYVKVPVSLTNAGAAVDVSAGTVQMAFTAVGVEPVSGDWKAATWETDATRSPSRYYARCLVGSTVVLADGTYSVWLKISGVGSEVPVRWVDTLSVT